MCSRRCADGSSRLNPWIRRGRRTNHRRMLVVEVPRRKVTSRWQLLLGCLWCWREGLRWTSRKSSYLVRIVMVRETTTWWRIFVALETTRERTPTSVGQLADDRER